MNNEVVSFPNLGLSFNINPVAISIGNIKIYWYGIIISFAIFLSLFLLKKKDGKYNIKFDDVFDFAIWGIIIGILSARLYYVLFNLDYYLKNIPEIFMINKRRTRNLWRNNRGYHLGNYFLQEKKD